MFENQRSFNKMKHYSHNFFKDDNKQLHVRELQFPAQGQARKKYKPCDTKMTAKH